MNTISSKWARQGRNLLGLCLLTMVIAACGGDDSSSTAQQGGRPGGGPGGFGGFNLQVAPPAVEVVAARIGSLPLEERITGRVIARNQTEIYPEVGGPITEIFVQNGDFVDAGAPLVQLRDSEFRERYQQALSGLEIAQAQTRQARAALELAEAQYRRMEELVERRLETTANLDTARSQLSIARADLDLRMAQENQSRSIADERSLQLQNATIRAPISGTVGQRNAEVGQLASTTSRLFVIGDLSQVRVEVLLSERMLNYIEEGEPVNIFSDSWSDTVLSGRVNRISPFLDVATLRTQAFIELENDEGLLRPGMFVTVDVLYGESEQAVLVPNSALYRNSRTGQEGVYVVSKPDQSQAGLSEESDEEGVGILAQPQNVRFVPTSIIATGRMAAAVRGINDGDWVVTLGQSLLEGGAEQARPRLLPWDYMLKLQELQSDDMFEIIDQQRQALSDSSS